MASAGPLVASANRRRPVPGDERMRMWPHLLDQQSTAKEGRKSLTSLWHSAHAGDHSTRSNGLFVGNAGAPACECAPERRVFRRGTESRSNARSTVRTSCRNAGRGRYWRDRRGRPARRGRAIHQPGLLVVSPGRRAAHQARARARPDSAVAAGRLLGSARVEGHPGAPQLYRATESLCRQARRRHGLYAAGCDQRARGRRRLASLRRSNWPPPRRQRA